jgi:organic hydroperoxide reductase OsmC/OhrA
MKISAQIHNLEGQHEVRLITNDQPLSLAIPPRPSGFGSTVNGGELLFLALATCYCNDIYREAELQNIQVQGVDVTVEGEFGAPGEPARNVAYRARVTARASEEAIRTLMQHTDHMAEIQNTLRIATPVPLAQIEAVSI